MAIDTYAALKAAAAHWLVRGDLTARIPDFVALAEARLNRVLRHRLAETEIALTAAPGLRRIPLPAGFTEPLRLWLEAAEGRIELPCVEAATLPQTAARGVPRAWAIDAEAVAFDRPCDQAYGLTLRMLKAFALSEAAPTNALLTEAPDVYLFATLCEAAPFLRDAELSGAYETRLDRALGELNAKHARSRALGTLRVEADLLAEAAR